LPARQETPKKTIAEKGNFFGSLQRIRPILSVLNEARSPAEKSRFTELLRMKVPSGQPMHTGLCVKVPAPASRVRHGIGVNLAKESQ
jgi:hypothetical protein